MARPGKLSPTAALGATVGALIGGAALVQYGAWQALSRWDRASDAAPWGLLALIAGVVGLAVGPYLVARRQRQRRWLAAWMLAPIPLLVAFATVIHPGGRLGY